MTIFRCASILLLCVAPLWASSPMNKLNRLDRPADIVHLNDNFKMLDSAINNTGVPAGAIIMWSGAIVDIPSGWALCDGTNETPDLKYRFILSVGASEEPGATGGSTTHEHTVAGHIHTITHTHTYSGSATTPSFLTYTTGDYQYTSGGDAKTSHQHAYSGTTSGSSAANSGSASPATDAQPNVPPYYKLAFIMKL